jgi:tetratricopeptide (TPR) repeat protein
MLPLCFVLMPFGRKSGAGGAMIDFDAVYKDYIAPAIREAGMEPLRADEEQAGGLIHKPMYERLILCDYAVADLTTANANVFYELGLRHGIKPASTVMVFAGGSALPFDVAPLRGLPYTLGTDGAPANKLADIQALAERLKAGRDGGVDSPVFQMLDGFPDIQRLKTDVFRDRVAYSGKLKERLLTARKQGLDALHAIDAELAQAAGGMADAEAGVVIDLYLSYRAVKAWGDMIALVPRMSRALAATPLVQEQLGFALNRAGQADEAERVLKAVIASRGPSSETCGLLGRVYKDRWNQATAQGDKMLARGFLKKAIDTYLQGFEADWRDAFPGINAVTLMTLQDPPDPRCQALIPVVRYAVQRRIASGQPDYWDHATLLELAVLGANEDDAAQALSDALAAVREVWEPESTAANLKLIRLARAQRNTPVAWAQEVEDALLKRASPAPGG